MKREGSFFPATVLWIVGLSFALKIVFALLATDMKRAPDELQYLHGARQILATGTPAYPNPIWDEAHASPVYPYLLAACFRLFPGSGVTAARIFQVVLSSLTVLLLYRISLRAFDRKTAVVAAAVTAFYPPLIGFSHYLYAETVYTFLLVALAAALLAAGDRPGMWRIFCVGLIGGVTALTRSVFLVQIPFLVAWFVLASRAGRKWSAGRVAVFLAGIFIVIAPWTARNISRYDAFLLIDSNAGNVLYKNLNAIRQENHDIGMGTRWAEEKRAYRGSIPFRPRVEIDNIAKRNSAEVRAAILFTLRHPVLYAKHCAIRAAELLNPTSFPIKAIRRAYYAGLPPPLGELLAWISLLSVMAVLAASAAGIWGGLANPDRSLPFLLVIGNIALAVLVVSMSRYRLPMMPLLIPFGVNALLQGKALFRKGGGWDRKRLAAAAITLVLLVSIWIVYIPYSL